MTSLTDSIEQGEPQLSDSPDSSSASSSISSSAISGPIVDAFQRGIPYAKTSSKQVAFEKSVALWLFDQRLPYNTVEKETFRRMISCIDPRLTVPSEKTFRTEFMPKMYQKLYAYFQRLVSEHVDSCAATTDFWTSASIHSFMSFAIHFITKNWERKIIVLRCMPFDEQHNMENIGVEARDILFEVKKIKFFSYI